jgi:hypothetical protein
VIVDVDAAQLIEPMRAKFGDTPLITRTPSGGAHLWYKGVAYSTNLRGQGLAVDVKSKGGMVIVPPSLNRQSGNAYIFERGSWEDLKRLPPFRREALAAPCNESNKASAAGSVTEGDRNDTLFGYLMRMAPKVDHYERILAVARNFNRQMFSPPLSAAEVEDTARQVWHYEATDQNWIGHPQCGVVLLGAVIDDLLSLPHGPDALVLLTVLWRFHGARCEPFAITSKAMARDHVIAAWKDPRRYTRARKVLEDPGLIELASPSRRDRLGRCTPAKFKLARPGAKNAPNITLHPSLCPRMSVD